MQAELLMKKYSLGVAALLIALVATVVIGLFMGFPANPEYAASALQAHERQLGKVLTQDDLDKISSESRISPELRPSLEENTIIDDALIVLDWYAPHLFILLILSLSILRVGVVESLVVALTGSAALFVLSAAKGAIAILGAAVLYVVLKASFRSLFGKRR